MTVQASFACHGVLSMSLLMSDTIHTEVAALCQGKDSVSGVGCLLCSCDAMVFTLGSFAAPEGSQSTHS